MAYLRILLANRTGNGRYSCSNYGHVLYLPTGWFEAARTGDILSRLNADTAVVQTTLATTLSMAVRNMILLFGGLVLWCSPLRVCRWWWGCANVVIPLIILARRLRASSRLAQEKLGELSAEAEEGISAIRGARFAQEEQMRKAVSG